MEKQLFYVPMLSLQEMSLRKIAVLLWNEQNTLASVQNFQFRSTIPSGRSRHWYEIVGSKVADKISKLQLPESLEKLLMQILKPVGVQITRWKLYHEAYLSSPNESFDVPILEKLQWTASGTVDYQKTAEKLVSCNVFDIVKRYKLACLYCLDNYIPEVWKELPAEDKMHFYCEKEVVSNFSEPLLHYCWPFILKGEEYRLDSMLQKLLGDLITFNEVAFQCSSLQGNKSAAKYFLQKLLQTEREDSIFSAANFALESGMSYQHIYPSFPNKYLSDVVFYLLSEMTPGQRIQIFKERPAEIFGCLLDWPWQDTFLDFADALWAWMQCEDLESRARNYDTLLDKLQDSVQYSDYYLPNLYQNIFHSSPNDFKKYFVEEYRNWKIFKKLFCTQDTETISVILSNLDVGDRLKLVMSKRLLNIFCYSISRGRGHMVEMFLREAGLSKEDKSRLKETFMRLLEENDDGTIKWETPEWRGFFEFLLDKTNASAPIKRNSDNET